MNWIKAFWKRLATPLPTAPRVFVQPRSNVIPQTQRVAVADEALSNFTPRAQQVLSLARKEADRFNHHFVGTEHLLLGIVALGQGTAVAALNRMGINLDTVRSEVEKQVGTNHDQARIGNIPYTPRVKKVLALAAREAKALNHTYVGTEHVLLGLLREGDSVAARVLANLGMDIEKTRQEILKELDPNYTPSAYAPGVSPSTTVSLPPKSQIPPRTATLQALGEPVDTTKQYDIYCTDWSQEVIVYRNARFKGLKHLFQKSQHDPLCVFVELGTK